jgi:hypothetical protein
MRKYKIIGGALTAILAASLTFAPAATAAESHHNTDPITTGCTSGAYVLSSYGMLNKKYNQVQGRVDLMYSPRCGTNWVNIYGNVSGNKYSASIFRGTVPGGGMHALVTNIGSDYSYQVYAPGSTCVTVGSNITDIATGVVEGNDLRTFC